MSRIFTGLALVAIIVLVSNYVLGMVAGDFNASAAKLRAAHQRVDELKKAHLSPSDPEMKTALDSLTAISEETRQVRWLAEIHKMLGILAALVTVLVNSISVTYFIGTGRWCQEVVDTYQLSSDFLAQSRRLKRACFPWSLAGIVSILVMVGLGAAADPLSSLRETSRFVMPHWVAATLGIAIIGWTFQVQVGKVSADYELITRIMNEVHRIRTERGLENS